MLAVCRPGRAARSGPAARAVAALFCALAPAASFRVVELDAGAPASAAASAAYSRGASASAWGGGADLPWSERLLPGGPLSARSAPAVFGFLPRVPPRVACPAMVGPYNDSAAGGGAASGGGAGGGAGFSGAAVYYCSSRAAGVCDGRTGACACFVGYAGADCGGCAPGLDRKSVV